MKFPLIIITIFQKYELIEKNNFEFDKIRNELLAKNNLIENSVIESISEKIRKTLLSKNENIQLSNDGYDNKFNQIRNDLLSKNTINEKNEITNDFNNERNSLLSKNVNFENKANK